MNEYETRQLVSDAGRRLKTSGLIAGTWGNISTSAAFGSEEFHMLTGFSEAATYWFALRAYDGQDWSAWAGTGAVVNKDSFNFATSSAPRLTTACSTARISKARNGSQTQASTSPKTCCAKETVKSQFIFAPKTRSNTRLLIKNSTNRSPASPHG